MRSTCSPVKLALVLRVQHERLSRHSDAAPGNARGYVPGASAVAAGELFAFVFRSLPHRFRVIHVAAEVAVTAVTAGRTLCEEDATP